MGGGGCLPPFPPPSYAYEPRPPRCKCEIQHSRWNLHFKTNFNPVTQIEFVCRCCRLWMLAHLLLFTETRYSNLCALCEHPEACDYPDIYSGYEGALRCLTQNGGEIAWTKVYYVKKHFGVWDQQNDNFNLGRVPWRLSSLSSVHRYRRRGISIRPRPPSLISVPFHRSPIIPSSEAIGSKMPTVELSPFQPCRRKGNRRFTATHS